MLGELIQDTRGRYPLPSLVSFSKVKTIKDEGIRKQMTDALLLSLQGHHIKAHQMFQDAVDRQKGVAA